MQSDFDKNLLDYFTDVEHLRGAFKEYVAALVLPKRLVVIHGVGGVGKSSLLRMFRIHCKNEKIPVALASGDDTKSVLDALTRWMEDLKADGVKFPALGKTLETYRGIQAKVGEQAVKAQSARGLAADIAGKAASKTAESAGGALMGAAIGSVIPGVGTAIGGALGGVLGGMGAEALVDWLRGFLSKPDIDLLLDPSKKLTTDFLEDLGKAAEKRRVVLMLDTFEQMSALDDWARDAAQRIHPNVLLVIAGRKLPDWNRAWPGWMMEAHIEELKPMSEEIMRQLIGRYYATMRGGEPQAAQVEAIIRFARGLPMVVTSAVQLWVKYGVEDFQSVKAEIVANLVDRLMEGVPPALIPALEAAAVARWFDQPILRAVTGLEDTREVYNELRRFPFVRTRVEGLALHDSVREMMDENLRMQDSERHTQLHERAAAYFEKRLEKATGEEAERLGLERLYHRIRADEEAGIQLFQEMAERLVRYRLINQLRILINDAITYPLDIESSKLWLKYYVFRLSHIEGIYEYLRDGYKSICENPRAPLKLQAYAYVDYGEILRTFQINEDAIPILEKGVSIIPLDTKLAFGLHQLSGAYGRLLKNEKALNFAKQMEEFSRKDGDYYALATALDRLISFFIQRGHIKNAQFYRMQLAKCIGDISSSPKYLKLTYLGGMGAAFTWFGHWNETEIRVRQALDLSSELELVNAIWNSRDLGYILGLIGNYEEALEKISYSMSNNSGYRKFDEGVSIGFRGAVLLQQGLLGEAKKDLEKSLEIKQSISDVYGIPEIYWWLGKLYELESRQGTQELGKLNAASKNYIACIDTSLLFGGKYFESVGKTGLTRVEHAKGNFSIISSLITEAEQLAQQYEYNDHLASLRLTQGHLTFDGMGDVASPLQQGEGRGGEQGNEQGEETSPLRYYKQAMMYALRFNRFLLDELLGGRPQGTPLRPIIPWCLERGEPGKKTLRALRDWWQGGVNDIGTPRPDSISPIPEGIALLEAEKIARQREPGDGSAQRSVVEQIEAAL